MTNYCILYVSVNSDSVSHTLLAFQSDQIFNNIMFSKKKGVAEN